MLYIFQQSKEATPQAEKATPDNKPKIASPITQLKSKFFPKRENFMVESSLDDIKEALANPEVANLLYYISQNGNLQGYSYKYRPSTMRHHFKAIDFLTKIGINTSFGDTKKKDVEKSYSRK